jgi:hypothetical protein
MRGGIVHPCRQHPMPGQQRCRRLGKNVVTCVVIPTCCRNQGRKKPFHSSVATRLCWCHPLLTIPRHGREMIMLPKR